jgi:DNA polymerase-3 subunit delta'
MVHSLSNFVGNTPLLNLLRRAQLPQSVIFSGPEGVGKKTLAVLLAGLENCAGDGAGDLCGLCSSCTQLKSLDRKQEDRRHPDILLADFSWVEKIVREKEKKKANPLVIPVAAIREIVKEAQYRPYQSEQRYFIIDNADRMNPQSQNALLKTLEEPIETTTIILVTAYPDKLLPTIHSRCQQFVFQRLTRTQITEFLSAENEPEEAQFISNVADGSIGKALTLDLRATLKDRDLMLELLSDWVANQSFASLFSQLEKAPLRMDLRKRERTLELLETLTILCQDLYLIKSSDPERIINLDSSERLEEIADSITLDWLSDFIYHIREAQQDIRSYVNTLVCFETLWLKGTRTNA